MSITIIKRKNVAGLQYLKRLVLKSIYEPKQMSSKERGLMEYSFVWWNKKLNLLDIEMVFLERLAWMVKHNNDGGFERRKEIFARCGINYKKSHRLSEAMI